MDLLLGWGRRSMCLGFLMVRLSIWWDVDVEMRCGEIAYKCGVLEEKEEVLLFYVSGWVTYPQNTNLLDKLRLKML